MEYDVKTKALMEFFQPKVMCKECINKTSNLT